MISKHILEKYQGIDNPFRMLIQKEFCFVACDYSDQIPSWVIESLSGPRYPLQLIREAISLSESRNYYSFYIAVNYKDYELHFAQMQIVDPRYRITVEEFIPANNKSINVLFWDWILDSKSTDEDRVIVLHTLPQRYRDDI